MFSALFGARRSRKQPARAKSAKRAQQLGFESLENRDLFAIAGPGIVVDHLTGFTTESKGTDIFFVQLTEQPSKTVTLKVTSSDTAEGKVSGTLTFTSKNWDQPEKHHFKVTGQPNGHAVGAFHYELTGTTTSKDPSFNNLAMPAISMTNFDQVPVKVTPILVAHQKGLVTTELNGTTQFTVELTHPLNAGETVTVPIHSSNTAEGTVDKSQLTFTTAAPQTVTITGQDDGLLFKKAVPYTIVFDPLQSTDPNSPYAGINPADVAVANTQRTDVGRFAGPYAGDFAGAVSVFGHKIGLDGHLDATVDNSGNVILTLLNISVPSQGLDFSTTGTGKVDPKTGKLSLTFADDDSPLSGRTIKSIPIVADADGKPLLKGKVSFTIDGSDFGLGNLPVTVNFDISRIAII